MPRSTLRIDAHQLGWMTGNSNRIVGQNYSSSGELLSMNGVSLGYDGFGRNTQVGQQTWWHSGAGADRVLVQKQNGSTTTQKIAFYAGALLQECDVYYAQQSWPNNKDPLLGSCTNRYFLAGRRVDEARDLRDSKWNTTRKFPFGEDALTSGSYTEEDHFASYRGAGDGVAIDYARHRSYAPTLGTFTSPDPYEASGGLDDSASWNRFAYVGGDPIGRTDRLGLRYQDRTECHGNPESEDLLCWEFPWWEPDGPGAPEPDPPTLPAETSCQIQTRKSGEPLLGQTFAESANPPISGLLGKYERGTFPAQSQGWFFAIQFIATLSGDITPENWEAFQTFSRAGSFEVEDGRTQPYGHRGEDNPAANRVVNVSNQMAFIDAPGLGRYPFVDDRSLKVVSADITWRFKTGFRYTRPDGSQSVLCETDWTLRLVVSDGNFDFYFNGERQ
jgi:RHS repeat-associated protein